MLTRRKFLTITIIGLSGLILPGTKKNAQAHGGLQDPRVLANATAEAVEIHMRSDRLGSEVWFDPIGVYIEPGQKIRWNCDENVHTTTAYHPQNNNHSLRIPPEATPWDSGFMYPGDRFEVNFNIEGVYDYYCIPHEAAGMVGRIIVGKPTGPGALPFEYFKGKQETTSWQCVPPAAQSAFPSIDGILSKRIIRLK